MHIKLLFSTVIMLCLLTLACQKIVTPDYHERVIAELNIGESKDIRLNNGETVNLSLISIISVRDCVRNAIRSADIKVLIDNEEVDLKTGNYNLPVTIGKIQIDCQAIKDYYENTGQDPWKLSKDARFRLWPKDSPWTETGKFLYPIRQAFFASQSQMSNEPTYVDWGENPFGEKIYYHSGLDFGGAEGLEEIISATDGIIISARNEKIGEGYDDVPAYLHPDAVNVVDDRGWLIRYVHLDTTDPAIQLGARVKMGQRIGYIGKQGSSGGWVHLHFAASVRDSATGVWMAEDLYPYVWEAYVNEYKPSMIAVARPHHLTWTGNEIVLDGSKSRSFKGDIVSYEWTLSNGTKVQGITPKISYDTPGEYCEILKVTDSKGNIDYDFTVVQVYDKANPENKIPTIHASYFPTLGIKPEDPVTFFVRTFNSNTGQETWDFGDGSIPVSIKSEYVERGKHTLGKYAEVKHSFAKSGNYVVTVSRENENGFTATICMHVLVND